MASIDDDESLDLVLTRKAQEKKHRDKVRAMTESVIGKQKYGADYGRLATYRAEWTFEKFYTFTRIHNKAQAEAFIQKVQTAWAGKPHVDAPITVEMTWGKTSLAFFLERHIRMSNMHDEYYLLHELAHIFTPEEGGHGPLFRSVLIKLVADFIGENAASDLDFYFSEENL